LASRRFAASAVVCDGVRLSAAMPWFLLGFLACACAPEAPAVPALPAAPRVATAEERAADERAIGAALDDWHAAAAHADEAAYFAHFAADAVFLGTDATERWTLEAFRGYAHPHFAAGKAWSFTPIRRAVTVDPSGALAWFDEDLATPNLGPARGAGVVVKRGGRWLISLYDLGVTVPNERFSTVKRAIAGEGACLSGEGAIHAVVTLRGAPPPPAPPPKAWTENASCKKLPFHGGALVARGGRLGEVVVRLAAGAVRGRAKPLWDAIRVEARECALRPHTAVAMVGQRIDLASLDGASTGAQLFRDGALLATHWQRPDAAPTQYFVTEPGVYTVSLPGRPWAHAFVVATDHPYFQLTEDDGEARIEHVPAGHYTLEAFHAAFGWRRQPIDVTDGKTTEVVVELDVKDIIKEP
jgi:hypothetical protein